VSFFTSPISSISRFALQSYWLQGGVLVSFSTHGKLTVKFTPYLTSRQRKYISTLFFNLDARWGRLVNATPWPFDPREWPSTNCIGSWVGPTPGLDGRRKSRQHQDSIPRPS